MTLGNHEFDDGVKGLVPFLRNQVILLKELIIVFKQTDRALRGLKH